jgi:hypothetical protein
MLIEKIHEEIGHFGEVHTLVKVKKYFFWHYIIEYVKRFVKICEKCQLTRESKNMRSNIEKMKNILICDFFYCVELGTTKPLLETKDGNKYVLITIKHYSKWCETQVVDADLIFPEPLHIYYNNNFYTTNIHSFITLH